MNRTILAAQMVYSMGITLFLATYVLWLQKVGLRLDEIAFVDIIFNLGILVFEVPTGVIADRFGRRVSFILSCIVRGTALIGLAFGVTFPMIAALMFLAAIGETMASGASESWLISNLRKDVRVRDVYRTLALIGGITSIIGGTIGAALYAVSPAMMWTASGAMLAVAAVIAAFAPEGPKDALGDIPMPMSAIIRETVALGRRLVREVRLVRIIVINAFATAGAGLFWQLAVIDEATGWAAGCVWISFVLAGILGAWAAQLAPQSQARALLGLSIGLWVLLPLGWLTNAWVALPFFLLGIFVPAFLKPNLLEMMNSQIPDKIRASALSMLSFATSVAGVGGVLLAGWLGEVFGPGAAIAWPAAIGGALIAIVALLTGVQKEQGRA